MRRLLILSADYTGHGHKSIANSLAERLAVYDDIDVKILDGFDLMTKVQKVCAEKTYGPVTRLPGNAWAVSHAAGMRFKGPLNRVITRAIRYRFYELLMDYKPDCILSVHPMFIGSILDLLDEFKMDIPFVTHEADLIDIALQWFDPRIDLVLAPSKESYDCTIEHGIAPEKVVEVAFPVRSRFMGLADAAPVRTDGELVVSVMSGSEGAGMIRSVVRELLKETDVRVNVICGRNKGLHKKLRRAFARKYPGRLNAMGFVERIQDVMLESDILIMRASPNSVMEAIALNKPVILFGQLAGQELHNPDMLQKHGLAVYCPEAERLPGCIAELTKDNGAAIERMRECQRAYAPGDVTARTAEILNDYIQPLNY